MFIDFYEGGGLLSLSTKQNINLLLFYLCICFNKIKQQYVYGCIVVIDVGGERKEKTFNTNHYDIEIN